MVNEFRIGQGGLLRRFESLCHLTNLRRQIFAVVLFAWVPMALFGVLNARSTGRADPLLHDVGVHVRVLVAMPAFLILDQLFPLVCSRTLSQLADQGFVPASARARFDHILSRARALADSPIPEAILFAACVGAGVMVSTGRIAITGIDARGGLTVAQTWYAVAVLPLFQFLLWRSFLRWGIWLRILAGLSRIPLELVPTHPDRRAGIAFLRVPSVGYCALLLFAVSSVLCAEYAARLTGEVTLLTFVPLLLLFTSLSTLIAFGPLLLFVPHLVRARREGLDEAGALSTHFGRHFRARWLEQVHTRCPPDSLSLHGLAALGESYRETADKVALLLFDTRDVKVLLLSTLLPLVPVVFARVSTEEWMVLVGAFFGKGR